MPNEPLRQFSVGFKAIAGRAGWKADEQVITLLAAIDANWPEGEDFRNGFLPDVLVTVEILADREANERLAS
jgi:hypothetical protein